MSLELMTQVILEIKKADLRLKFKLKKSKKEKELDFNEIR